MSTEEITRLSGQFLIALPDMGDPRFEKAVIYICSHDSSGAMGLIINRSKGALILSEMLDQIGIDGSVSVADSPVLDGGPVDIDRGFVLHTADYFKPDSSLRLSETLALSSTKDVLEALTSDEAPDQAILAVGYSGWGAGQLESEIQRNVWMIVPASEKMIFDTDLKSKWTRALAQIGVTPEILSAGGGSA